MDTLQNNTILLVEDTISLAETYAEFLRQAGYDVVMVDTGQKALTYLNSKRPATVVLDLLLPDMNGLSILTHAQETHPGIPMIVVTVNNSVDVAVEAMQRGAYDFIVKPFSAPRLLTTLANALEHKKLVTEVTELRQVIGRDRFYQFIGQSPAMQAVYRIIEAVAPSKASVFLQGENGTGKELAANAIHNASPRRNKPFITLNCAAIPHELMESTIFGHIKGAFTGAVSDQPGAAKAAHGGTLFLDEICELPLELQTKLLRFIQTGESLPVGSNKPDFVDVRIISATNRNLREEVMQRRFREDLYYRLHVIPIDMPALRDREDDIFILASHFLSRFSAEEGKHFTSLSPEVMSLFRRYDWPGNVRQLENVMRNVVVLNDSDTVTEAMLPKDLQLFIEESLAAAANQNSLDLMLAESEAAEIIQPLWMTEKEAIMKALQHTGQDIGHAASLLEVSPSTLYRKLQNWRYAESLDQKTAINL